MEQQEGLSIRDVNGADRLWLVVIPYLICWINICLILVSIYVGILSVAVLFTLLIQIFLTFLWSIIVLI